MAAIHATVFPLRRTSYRNERSFDRKADRKIKKKKNRSIELTICPRFSPKQASKQASRFENRNRTEEIYRESFIHGRWTQPRTVYIVLFKWTDCVKELLVSLFYLERDFCIIECDEMTEEYYLSSFRFNFSTMLLC